MSPLHDPRHDDLLQRIATGGEASLSSAELVEVRACGVCGEQRRELAELESSLRSYGREERELLAEASEPGDVPGSEVVREFAATRIAEARAPKRKPRGRFVLRALAAAAVLAVFVLGIRWWPSEPPDPPDAPLGNSDTIELVAPDPAHAFDSFEWRGKLPPRGWFEIDVRVPATNSTPARPLLAPRPRVYAGLAWTPTEEQRAAWPDEIEWRVTSSTSDGIDFAASPWQARRRQPH